MRQKSITLKDLLETCLEKLDDGTYQAPGEEKNRFFICICDVCLLLYYYCSVNVVVYVDHNDFFFLLDTRTTRISSSTRTCYECALKNFKELAYQFRQDISSDDLPGK